MKVADVVGGGITADDCEALWGAHQTFLGLPRAPSLSVAFVAMVQDTLKNLAAAAEADDDDDDDAEDEAMEADDEGVHSLKTKRTPKPSAKLLAASPSKSKPHSGSRLGAAAPSPPSSVKRSRAAAMSALGPFYPPPSAGGDDTGSARRKRQRKLFSNQDEDDVDELDPDLPSALQPGSASKRHQRKSVGARGGSHDDVGEGVDALLHLASVADHATEGSIDHRGDSSVANASGRPSATPPIERHGEGGQKEGTVEGSMPPPPHPQ